MTIKELAIEVIMEAEERGISTKRMVGEFAKEFDVNVRKLYKIVQELEKEDEKKGQKIDKLID